MQNRRIKEEEEEEKKIVGILGVPSPVYGLRHQSTPLSLYATGAVLCTSEV